jgi:hypothetical protein
MHIDALVAGCVCVLLRTSSNLLFEAEASAHNVDCGGHHIFRIADYFGAISVETPVSCAPAYTNMFVMESPRKHKAL